MPFESSMAITKEELVISLEKLWSSPEGSGAIQDIKSAMSAHSTQGQIADLMPQLMQEALSASSASFVNVNDRAR